MEIRGMWCNFVDIKLTIQSVISMKKTKIFRLLLAVLVAMMTMPMVTSAQDAIPYVIFDEKTKVATLYYGGDVPVGAYEFFSNGYMSVEIESTSFSHTYVRINLSNLSGKIKIDPSFAKYKPISCANWFAYHVSWYHDENHISGIDGLEYINTENVTDMSEMFSGCDFIDLDLSNLNTAKVTNMNRMFEGCKKLETIYVSDKWSTSEVTESENMFWGCENLFGEKGTECVPDKVGHEFAKIDGGESAPGYLTQKGNKKYIFNGKCPYATLKNNTLTFYYDNKCPNDAYKIAKFRDDWYKPNWLEADFSKVVFDKSFAEYKPNKLGYWFLGCENIKEIVDLQNLNTQDVTNMDAMFEDCSSLTSLDLSNFNTQDVTNMDAMFSGCSSLTTLDLSNFNTKNVTTMMGMFSGCSSLTTLDLGNFNTQNVTNMMGMFFGCSSLTTLDLSSFDTEKAELRDMFTGCSNLTTIFAGDKWSTKSVYVGSIDEDDLDLRYEEVYITGDMFAGCTSLVGGKGTKFDENNITYTYAHIDGGQGNPGYLTAVEIVSISVTTLPKTTYLEGEDLNLDGGIVSVNYNNGRIETTDLAKAEISGFDKTKSGEQTLTVKYLGQETSFKVTVKSPTPYATFTDGILTLGYGSDIPENAAIISEKLSENDFIASQLTTADKVTKIVIKPSFADFAPTTCEYWFMGCENLTEITGFGNINTENVGEMGFMFGGCGKLTELNLGGFNTKKVTDMSGMFSNCVLLATIFVGDHWNTAKVESSYFMFSNCKKIVGGKGTKYDANNIEHSFARIDGGKSSPGYFTKSGEKPYDGTTTPVSEISAKSNVKIWSFGSTLFVENATTDIYIINSLGMEILQHKADSDRIEIQIPRSGVYIVKTGAKSQKVLIN